MQKMIPGSNNSGQTRETRENSFGTFYTGVRLPKNEQKYECSLCQDQEIVQIGVDQFEQPIFGECSCKTKKVAARKLKSSGLTTQQLKYQLEDYQVNKNNQQMFEGVKRYLKVWPELINSDSDAKGFCLIGTPGIGKTMLSCIIAKDMLSKGISAVFVSSADLMAELRQSQFSKTEKENIEAKIETLGKVQALILDDIGKEKPTEWVQAMYYRLIDLRYRNNLLTGFNSNYYPKVLQERLGEFGGPAVSRLFGMTREHFLVGEDKDHRLGG